MAQYREMRRTTIPNKRSSPGWSPKIVPIKSQDKSVTTNNPSNYIGPLRPIWTYLRSKGRELSKICEGNV